MVPDRGCRRDRNIHGTACVAGFAASAGRNIAFDLKDSKQVEYSQNSTIRAGILAYKVEYSQNSTIRAGILAYKGKSKPSAGRLDQPGVCTRCLKKPVCDDTKSCSPVEHVSTYNNQRSTSFRADEHQEGLVLSVVLCQNALGHIDP